MESWLALLSHYGLFLVFLGALVEGETVLVLTGVLVHQQVLPFVGAGLVASLGAILGDQFFFHAGRRGGPHVLARFPRLARSTARIRPWVERRADWIAAGSRFVYGTRIAAPVLLGSGRYSGWRFLFFNVVSGVVWAFASIGAGYVAGEGVERLAGRIVHVERVLLGIALAMFGWWWVRYGRSSPASDEPPASSPP